MLGYSEYLLTNPHHPPLGGMAKRDVGTDVGEGEESYYCERISASGPTRWPISGKLPVRYLCTKATGIRSVVSRLPIGRRRPQAPLAIRLLSS